MKEYDSRAIEEKWRAVWEKEGAPLAIDHSDATKTYLLVEFPYPSGDGLHVGHVRGYTAMDIVARKRRRLGENVLYPIGWDAFGLPTENYAIKMGRDPREITKENTDNFREQMKRLGLSFDWSREVNTTDPSYYRWTQWIFLQLYKHGLAYKAKVAINWCPKDKIGLANEEVVDGKCERCGTAVEKREREQWMLAITKYAERLYDDLDTVDYIERAKAGQRNWIGKSEGAEIKFKVISHESSVMSEVAVFTTRPDTIFGATYVVVAPEHQLVQSLVMSPESSVGNKEEVRAYVKAAAAKEEIERTAEGKEKTGVRLEGVVAINPATKEEIPIFVADYVLGHYGTGAVMAVPAHDERDFAFAKKYGLPIKQVVASDTEMPYTGEGALINSEGFDGVQSGDVRKKITEHVGGVWTTKFKLRDWVFSRQRYWGEPIPIMYCRTCWENPKSKIQNPKEGVDYVVIDGKEHAIVPVPEEQLPVELPYVKAYEPTDTGDSPLASMEEWVNTTCPSCGGPAKRETDVMPNWAGSSWYYIAYVIRESIKSQVTISKELHSEKTQERLKYWLPVDWYNGGMEHTTLHLLYSRFWHKFLYDIKAVPTPEPYAKRTSHGMILAENGEKMSKSKGNVINPDEIVDRFGVDTLRVYEMFMGPFDQAIAWSTDGLVGVRRFLERIIRLKAKTNNEQRTTNNRELETVMHQTIKKVGEDIEVFRMNTAVSQLMIFGNALEKEEAISKDAYETLLMLLAPFAPFLTEELWHGLGHDTSIHAAAWPDHDPLKLAGSEVTIAIQVNGKLRGSIEVARDTDEATALGIARAEVLLEKWLNGKDIIKVIYVPNRVLNLVVRDA